MEITITKDNFDAEVMNSDKPVLIDFWAAWCGPCRSLAPIIAEIAEEKAGEIKVCKVNVDEEPALAGAFNVTGIPTLVVINNREIVNMGVGYMPKEDVLALLK